MSDLAIRVEGLGKRYRIAAQPARYRTLRDALVESVRRSFRRLRASGQDNGSQTIWALRDVSFEVRQGEVLGIIGRNGAGKSTLLKILSRITEPTEGYVEIRGRVGSLLEVGTGFHPELTGRENIYLNGAILGMRRAEIQRRFDEIVSFAEMEPFIETPVKYYSSGMYMRLAFAVAAHLEPDILLVDEVLAVGDAAFQQKCLGKMGEVAREGRTVLFVSHNLGAIQSLTHRCLYIKNGQIAAANESARVIEHYLTDAVQRCESKHGVDLNFFRREGAQDPAVQITAISVRGGRGGSPELRMGTPFFIIIQIQVYRPLHGANLAILLKNSRRELVTVLFSWDQGFSLSCGPGRHVVGAYVDGLLLAPGQYFADVGINQSTDTKAYDVIVDFPIFKVFNAGHVTQWLERPWGAVHTLGVTWRNVEVADEAEKIVDAVQDRPETSLQEYSHDVLNGPCVDTRTF